ncbi:DUF4148 domain-containing protein [Cupriavidus metallidurans]|uniref:DUF4148 domain-containing protein n=1 Tax=Cupriavidus metallidurans TaxID=119219 RepID=UPI001CC9B57F|nr:DUF4148 domain-containing protein [Cupriavidus metallidurans]UBM07924.1 DUF4148 domain-containing protein [Cupriavidus metallidurans]
MKKILAIVVVAAITPAGVFAQGADTKQSERTRTDVKQELVKAQHDGTLVRKDGEYPPSPTTVNRNKAEHAEAKHANEGKNPSLDKHDHGS